MDIKVGMKLELINDLEYGYSTLSKGEVFKVEFINGDRYTLVSCRRIGVGVFSECELRQLFKKHIGEINKYEDVKKVIVSNNVTIVILNNGVKGVSKCMECDKYNEEIGYRVAYLKAKRKEIEKELKRY